MGLRGTFFQKVDDHLFCAKVIFGDKVMASFFRGDGKVRAKALSEKFSSLKSCFDGGKGEGVEVIRLLHFS